MALYIGNTCPVCGEKFKDDDDVVVCPDCGTPYHRACWQKTGVCLHQAEHAAGFEWHPEPAGGSADAEDAVCPNCGTKLEFDLSDLANALNDTADEDEDQ